MERALNLNLKNADQESWSFFEIQYRTEYAYDIPGDKPVSISNKNSKISYFRNLKGQNLYESITGAGELSNYPEFSISSDYNPRGLLSEQQTTIGNFQYNYDELNRLTSMNANSKNFNFRYDDASRLSEFSSGPIRTVLSYQDQKLNKILYLKSDVTIAEHEYSYNLRNYPSQKRNLASVTDYSYDSNGQLTQASGATNEAFTYDNIGNRLSDNSRSYEYDITGQRLNQDTFFTYQYDNNGNLINKISRDGVKESHHYEYSSMNQLIKVQVMSGSIGSLSTIKEVQYAYDVLGRRMQKEVKDFINSKAYTRKFAYNGSSIIAEFDSGNALLAKYTHSPLSADDLLSVDITTQGVAANLGSFVGTYYYLKDNLNSVSEITDSNGNIVQKFEYSSYGEISKIKDSGENLLTFNQAPIRTSFTFTGREFDSETGLYFYRARYYDASSGRFLQQDPNAGYLSHSLTIVNKYLYAVNNPISFSDPSGRDIWDELGKGLSIAAGVAVAFYAGAYIAAYLGISGVTGAIVGAFTGALVGGTTTAIGYSLSHANPNEGFRIGASAGLFAGGAGGFLGSSVVSAGKAYSITSDQVYSFVKSQASSAASGFQGGSELVNAGAKYYALDGWPIWSTMASYANAVLPYAVATGEAAAIGYLDKCTGARDCSELNALIPNSRSQTWKW